LAGGGGAFRAGTGETGKVLALLLTFFRRKVIGRIGTSESSLQPVLLKQMSSGSEKGGGGISGGRIETREGAGKKVSSLSKHPSTRND